MKRADDRSRPSASISQQAAGALVPVDVRPQLEQHLAAFAPERRMRPPDLLDDRLDAGVIGRRGTAHVGGDAEPLALDERAGDGGRLAAQPALRGVERWLAGDLDRSGAAAGRRLVDHYGAALAEVILDAREFPIDRLAE